MGISSSECPKCSGVIEEGFILDLNGKNKPSASIWIEGSGKGDLEGVKEKSGLRKYRIQAYRCMSCGYVENYAEIEI